MKKILVLVVALMMTALLFLTGCSVDDSREGQLNDILDETNAGLVDTFSDSTTKFEMVEDYLASWAKNNNIEVTKTGKHCMVLTNKATEGIKCDSLALHVAVDTEDMTSTNRPLAVALTSLLGPEQHGKIKLIVTETNDEGYMGSDAIAEKYLKVDNLISINQRSKVDLKIGGAYAFDATLNKEVSYEEPTYAHAYEIKLTIDNYKDAFDYTAKYPNPIDVIGSYLASNQSSGKLFQLASFKCKVSDCSTPYSASAIVVIDDNNVESMKKKFDKSYESVNKKCDKIEANFVYTMNETTMPEKVLTHESSSSLISLMYTLDTGIYYQDEDSGDIISANTITNLKAKDGKFILDLTGRSKTKESLVEMNTALKTTAGLTDYNYSAGKPYITWEAQDELADYFLEALSMSREDNHTTLLTSDLNILTSKKPGLNCILYSVSDDNDTAAMHNFIHFMSHLAGTDEETE